MSRVRARANRRRASAASRRRRGCARARARTRAAEAVFAAGCPWCRGCARARARARTAETAFAADCRRRGCARGGALARAWARLSARPEATLARRACRARRPARPAGGPAEMQVSAGARAAAPPRRGLFRSLAAGRAGAEGLHGGGRPVGRSLARSLAAARAGRVGLRAAKTAAAATAARRLRRLRSGPEGGLRGRPRSRLGGGSRRGPGGRRGRRSRRRAVASRFAPVGPRGRVDRQNSQSGDDTQSCSGREYSRSGCRPMQSALAPHQNFNTCQLTPPKLTARLSERRFIRRKTFVKSAQKAAAATGQLVRSAPMAMLLDITASVPPSPAKPGAHRRPHLE